MSKELSEMCPLGEKMAKIWLKLQENGEKKSEMAKVMAKEKYILARTLQIHCYFLLIKCENVDADVDVLQRSVIGGEN